jgi:hypothetical protein
MVYVLHHKLYLKNKPTVAPVVQGGTTLDQGTNPKAMNVDKGKAQYEQIRRNIIKTLAIVTIFFAILWVPNQSYWFLVNLVIQLPVNGPAYHLSVVFVYINCIINPFIYGAKYKEFQKAVLKIFCPKRQRAIEISSNQSDQTKT